MPKPAKQEPVPKPRRGVSTVTNGAPPPANPLSILNRVEPMTGGEGGGIKILIYGQSGSGKTTLWATFPGRILVAVASGGVKTGELRSVNTPEYREKIDRFVIDQTSDFGELVNELRKAEHGYQTVVLDHVSGYQDLVLKEVLGIGEIPVMKNWGMASLQQYGQVATQCREAFRGLLDLDCNVVLVGQEKVYKLKENVDPELGLVAQVGVNLQDGVALWLNPAVDYVVRTFVVQKTESVTQTMAGQKVTTTHKVKGRYNYCLQTGPHDVYMTKFRRPMGGTPLPEYVVDPTYDKIKALIDGGDVG